MTGRDVIVVGASAGGVEALTELVASLPPDLPAAVLIVLHFPAHHTSALPEILTRAGLLPATHPHDGECIQHGHIYVAPPDMHMLVEPDSDADSEHIHLIRGPRQNGHRPAIDPLFRTAAQACGSRVVGVILSGLLDDGTSGIRAIKRCGGLAVIQDPKDALYANMPLNAIENAPVDYVLPLSEVAATLVQAATQLVEHSKCQEQEAVLDELADTEAEFQYQSENASGNGESPDRTALLTCPECGGVLQLMTDGPLVHYRCHVGHSYSIESLDEAQSTLVEKALWTAVRALEERSILSQRMAKRARATNRKRSAVLFEKASKDEEQRAQLIRNLIMSDKLHPVDEEAVDRSDTLPDQRRR